ncbi:hypothetical protein BTVI_10931 [Pitangus sulphuratus]|nr:hypothetical protein BTVI_10931 [Pitangus sulphuratus]
MVFLEVSCGTGCVSSHPVVVSNMVSTYLGSLVCLFIVAMLLIGSIFGHVGIYMVDSHSQLLYPASAPESKWVALGLTRHLLSEAPEKTIIHSCRVEYILHIWSCPDWPKGYSMGNLLLNLLKCLLLFRAPLEIILLVGYQIERAYDLTVLGDVPPPETYGTQKSLRFLLAGGWSHCCDLIDGFCQDLAASPPGTGSLGQVP